MRLLDFALIGVTGGLVYYTWNRKKVAAPQPLPEVKKLVKKIRAAAKSGGRPSSPSRSIVDDRSSGRRVATANTDGATARHVVGRGVRSV